MDRPLGMYRSLNVNERPKQASGKGGRGYDMGTTQVMGKSVSPPIASIADGRKSPILPTILQRTSAKVKVNPAYEMTRPATKQFPPQPPPTPGQPKVTVEMGYEMFKPRASVPAAQSTSPASPPVQAIQSRKGSSPSKKRTPSFMPSSKSTAVDLAATVAPIDSKMVMTTTVADGNQMSGSQYYPGQPQADSTRTEQGCCARHRNCCIAFVVILVVVLIAGSFFGGVMLGRRNVLQHEKS